MPNITKKIVAIAMVLSVSGLLVGPGVAQAITADELQDQINALMTQLSGLQAQLAAMGGGGVAVTCTFTRALSPGVSGADVMCLQEYLNSTGNTLAASGPGSPGNETQYYGPLTQGAVQSWQDANGVVYGAWGGYFGPISQSKYDQLAVMPPAEEEEEEEEEEEPIACVGEEGSYSLIISATPVGRTINAGDGIEAYGIDVTAVSSDITIGRVDFQAAVVNAVTAVAENPGNFIKEIRVYDTSVSDDNLLATLANPVFAQDAAAVWHVSLGSLGFVVLKDTTKKLLIVIDTNTTIDQNRTVTLQVYGNNGVRGVDCSGINTFVALATTRILTVQQPGVATVAVTLAADNPKSNNIAANATNGVQTKEILLSLNAKATAGNAALLRLEVTYASAASASTLPNILYLYDGETLVSSVTPPVSGVAVFENFTLTLVQDVSKNLKVKADWAATTAFESGGAAFVLTYPAGTAADLLAGVYQRVNGQQLGIVNAADIAGNTFWITESGLKLTFVSGTATYTVEGIAGGTGIATGTIVFKVQPFGGTLVEPAYASGATDATAGVVTSGMLVRIEAPWASGGDAAASGAELTIARTLQSSLGAGQNVAEGQEATVTMKMDFGKTTSTANGNISFKVEDICSNVGGTLICQGTSSGIGGAGTGNLLDNWITNSVNMTP
ncbi:hypothetical protein IH779_01795 [Patescibacteria group bacterium]|nr:hypothetical protein [Patescibacteria group bacterium]